MHAQQHSKRTLGHKKAAKCRSKLLAYPSFTYIETMQTARSVLRNFLWNKKAGNARWITACFASCVLSLSKFHLYRNNANGEVGFAQFPME